MVKNRTTKCTQCKQCI